MTTAHTKTALLPYELILSIAVFLSIFTDLRSIWSAIEEIPIGNVLLFFSQVFFAVHLVVFIWRILLCLKYQPTVPCDNKDLPTCSVIVPAYNEGCQVFTTIQSIVQSDYPPEKMSILCIDDGSEDDTWQWLKKAAKEFPGRVQLFRQPVNRGKRHALYRGFKHGKGDVFVTIDSDSIVGPQTIRHLLSPFVRNHRVGAVAGNVHILNRQEGAIPKMLEVAFAYSFDFLRAGQSVINSVMCTPGALSAYRREVVLKVLFEWLNQKFCGRAANIGEDRAMTNLILRSGYHVHYQREAVAHTTSPITFPKLWKMLLRWARSNVRETLVISRFVFGRFRQDGAIGLRVNVLIGWMNMTLGQVMRLSAVALLAYLPLIVGPKMLIGAAIASCAPGIFYAVRYKSNHAIWALPYSFFWMVCLSWIGLYALMSPHKNEWMTRNLKMPSISETPSPGKKCSFRPPCMRITSRQECRLPAAPSAQIPQHALLTHWTPASGNNAKPS
jgi:hyaluronan synthase